MTRAPIIDVPTTKREKLTPTEKLALYEFRKGICCICGEKIEGKTLFIDEHGRALGLGGTNAISNRFIAHMKCAALKTAEQDIPRIAKAKRQKIKHIGADAPSPHPIKSAGFTKIVRDKVKIDKSQLPPLQRRSLYEDVT